MQPAVDEAEKDVIIPWLLVWAAISLAAFTLIAMLLAGKGETPVDLFVLAPRHDLFLQYGSSRIHLLVLLFTRAPTPPGLVCCSLLAMAFAPSGWKGVAWVAIGPIPMQPILRRPLLLAAEILVAVFAISWYVIVPLEHLINRWGMFYDYHPPVRSIVLAIAFWGTLARIASRQSWRPHWRYVTVAALFTISSASIFDTVYTGWAWPTDALASACLGVAIACVGSWFVEIHG